MFPVSAYKTKGEPQQGYSVKWEKYRKTSKCILVGISYNLFWGEVNELAVE